MSEIDVLVGDYLGEGKKIDESIDTKDLFYSVGLINAEIREMKDRIQKGIHDKQNKINHVRLKKVLTAVLAAEKKIKTANDHLIFVY